MKKIFLLFLVLVSGYCSAQNIDSLFRGIEIRTMNAKDAKVLGETLNYTQFKSISENSDSAVFAYILMNNEKDPMIAVYLFNSTNVQRIKLIEERKGKLVINKTSFLPGSYDIEVNTNGTLRTRLRFNVEKQLDQKKQVGNYLIYWSKSGYKLKYTAVN